MHFVHVLESSSEPFPLRDLACKAQDYLGRGQSIPIVGPLLLSPILAITSIAQVIIGAVATLILGSATCVTLAMRTHPHTEQFSALTFRALVFTAAGWGGFCYAAVNIATLGAFGYIAENTIVPEAGHYAGSDTMHCTTNDTQEF